MFVRLMVLVGCLPVAAGAQQRDPFEAARHRMVDEFIAAEGVSNERVLDAMRSTPRHEFVRPSERAAAYFDAALPIGHAQTISPPFIVAYMTETIDPQPTDKILEIGTGSGYQAAVLSPLVQDVYSIEIVEQLARTAERRLKDLRYKNVHVKAGDGYQGWPEHAPFDKIIVTCSPERVPRSLVEQLAEGGKLLIPLGERYQQVFYLFEKRDGKLESKQLIPTLFVPMTGVSEERRQVRPDPARPQILNGGFEDDDNGDGRPDGWHYLRQATLREDDVAAGERSLRIENDEPGRLAQTLQGFAVDGRQVAMLDVSAEMRSHDLRVGPNRNERPGVVLLLFDDVRKTIATIQIEPDREADGWSRRSRRVPLPPQTREAIFAVTLGGGTGVLEIDEVSITATPR